MQKLIGCAARSRKPLVSPAAPANGQRWHLAEGQVITQIQSGSPRPESAVRILSDCAQNAAICSAFAQKVASVSRRNLAHALPRALLSPSCQRWSMQMRLQLWPGPTPRAGPSERRSLRPIHSLNALRSPTSRVGPIERCVFVVRSQRASSRNRADVQARGLPDLLRTNILQWRAEDAKHLLEYAQALQKSRRDNRQREMAPGT
jgi:hypothetical protein